MPILTDFHTHTCFSEDSTALPSEMIESAISRGLTQLCFTEHLDLDFPDEGLFQVDIPAYHASYQELCDRYRGRIELLFGIELGMQPQLPARYEQILNAYPFDFVIASQHLVRGLDPYEPDVWKQASEETILHDYFREQCENLRNMSSYDTCAHLDYAVRYAAELSMGYDFSVFKDDIEAILCTVIDTDHCLEVNSAGIRKGLRNPNPSRDILQLYYDMGGKLITIGSDAHTPEDIAADFSSVRELLVSIGFREYQVFKKRERLALPL